MSSILMITMTAQPLMLDLNEAAGAENGRFFKMRA